jgi:hypothetical protein
MDPEDEENCPFNLPNKKPMSWQWLNTVNRVNTQVKKVRAFRCCSWRITGTELTTTVMPLLDLDPSIRDHPSELFGHPRRLRRSRTALEEVLRSGSNNQAFCTRQNARLNTPGG